MSLYRINWSKGASVLPWCSGQEDVGLLSPCIREQKWTTHCATCPNQVSHIISRSHWGCSGLVLPLEKCSGLAHRLDMSLTSWKSKVNVEVFVHRKNTSHLLFLLKAKEFELLFHSDVNLPHKLVLLAKLWVFKRFHTLRWEYWYMLQPSAMFCVALRRRNLVCV